MSSELLKWLAAGLVASVLGSTLWMAHNIRPERGHVRLLLAQAPSPAPAASAPAER